MFTVLKVSQARPFNCGQRVAKILEHQIYGQPEIARYAIK